MQGKEEEGKGGQMAVESHSCFFFCWAGLRRSWGPVGHEGSCQQWVVGTAQVLALDEFHLSHQLGDCLCDLEQVTSPL